MSIRLGIGLDIFSNRIDSEAQAIYDRIIAIPNGFSNLSRLNFFVKGLKAIYGTLSNVPVCYDAHWIGGVLGSGVGATAGQACARLCSLTVAGDAIQATASAQPLLLMHGGASSDNYWYGSGVAGNYCSTPNAAANQITGDIELISKISLQSITSYISFISKFNGSVGFIFNQTNTGKLELYATLASGSIDAISTVSHGFAVRTIFYVKVTRQVSSGDVKFYTSTDGINYTQLGATITGTSGNLNLGSSSLNCGCDQNGINNILPGKIYRATISNSIGGTPVVDFNPSQYNAATSQTQWTSTTGEIWSINKSSGSTFVGVLVDRTILQGNNTTTSMVCSSLAATQTFTEYLAATRNGTGNFILRATGNIRSATGTNLTLNNGTLLNRADTSILRRIITYLSKNTTSSISVNNDTATVGDSGTNNGTDLTILQGAHNINTVIQTLAEDTTPQRLAMFNLLKSINNL